MKSLCRFIIFLVLFHFCFVSFSSPLLAQTSKNEQKNAQKNEQKNAQRNIELNFTDIEIRDLVDMISKVSERSFIFDEKKFRNKKITLISHQKFTKEEAIKTFELVLSLNGLAIIERDGIYNIVTDKEAKVATTPFIPPGDRRKLSTDGQYVTQVIRINYANVNNLRSSLSPLLSKSATLSMYAPGNILIVNDQKKNIDRLLRIIQVIDVAQEEGIVTIQPLKHAAPDALIQILTKIFPTGGTKKGAASGVKNQFISDKINNRLIIIASRSNTQKIKSMIKQLDFAKPSSAQPTIVNLRFSTARAINDILRKVFQGTSKQGGGVNLQETLITPIEDNGTQLLILADKKTTQRVMELIRRLDQPSLDDRVVAQVTLQFAEVESIISILTRVYAPRQQQNQSTRTIPQEAPLITSIDEKSKRILIIAEQEMVDKIRVLIEQLDQPSEEEKEKLVNLIPVQYVEATALIQVLSQIFPSGAAQANNQQEDGKSVFILTPVTLNRILLIAEEKATKQVQQLIRELDQPKEEKRVTTLVDLQFSQAEAVISILTKIFPPGQQNNNAAAVVPAAPVVTLLEAVNNRILIVADRVMTGKIQQLISELDQPSEDEENVFSLVQLQFAKAGDISTLLGQVFSAQGTTVQQQQQGTNRLRTIIPIEANNQLLIIASLKETRKIKEIISNLDQAKEERLIKLIPIRFAIVGDIVKILTDLEKETTTETETNKMVTFLSDARTNMVIALAPEEKFPKIYSIIEQLDQEIPGGGGTGSKFRVFPLKNAKAKEMAEVLGKVTKSIQAAAKIEKANSNQQEGNTPAPPTSSTKEENADIAIIPDIPTNSLVIFAQPEEFPTLERVIAELDITRAQVFVEALIMEVTLDKSLQFGIDWRSTSVVGNAGEPQGAVTAGSNIGGNPQTFPVVNDDTALVGYLGAPIEFAGGEYNSFAAFIKANQTDEEIDILANPHIMTLSNEEAEIKVGQIVPTLKGITLDSNQNPVRNYDYKEVGISLNITPQINADDSIQLKILQTSDSVIQGSGDKEGAITTLSRSLKTNVLVGNRQTIVLGGLISDQVTTTETQTPCLGDIPILGWFFKSRSTSVRKTNLLVFLTPRVIRSGDDLQELTKKATEKLNDAKRGKFRVQVSKEYQVPSLVKEPDDLEEEETPEEETPEEETPEEETPAPEEETPVPVEEAPLEGTPEEFPVTEGTPTETPTDDATPADTTPETQP